MSVLDPGREHRGWAGRRRERNLADFEKKEAGERSIREADRRFALLVALMTPERRPGERFGPGRDQGEGQDEQRRQSGFDQPALDGGNGERLHRQNLVLLLFAGCAVAAILFIVAASFITF